MAFSRKRQEEGAPDKTTAADILAERAADGSLSRRAVDALHDRFRARIQAKVDAAAPSGKADENLRATLFEYALAASKGRAKLKSARLAELAAGGARAVRGQIRLQDHEGRRAENSLSVRLAAWKARRRNYYDERLFQGRDRIYIPVDRHADPDLAELRERIESRLGDRGYADIDYEGGYCCDRNGNKVKLGKTLRKFEPDLYDRFQRDPTRGEPHYAVISRKPSDIARMSSGRGWRSCMAVGGPYWDQVPPQIAKGVVVAYLVRESDPDIHDPLARLLAKPFEDKRGDVILEPDRAYGMSHRGFSEAVRAHLDRTQNLGLTGKFYLRADIYTDDLFPVCHRHPDDPRAMPEQPAKAPKAPAAPGGFQ